MKDKKRLDAEDIGYLQHGYNQLANVKMYGQPPPKSPTEESSILSDSIVASRQGSLFR